VSASANAARLDTLTRTLMERWQQTRHLWRDAKAQEFEDRYLRPLESEVRSAIGAVERLEAVLRKIRSDCG
jgi:hypothetical protein